MSEMTPRERLMAAIQGQPVDRTPWSPCLAYWWEAQDEALTRQGQLSYLESIGADPLLRGVCAPWRLRFRDVDIRTEQRGGERRERWETPVGALTFGYRHSDAGNTWFLVDHPIAETEDFKVLQWIYERAELEYDPDCDEQLRQTGERGLVMPLVGSECKTCFQSLVEKWVGAENLIYLLADEPEQVEECLAVMRRVSDRTADLCAQSSGEAFIFWEDSSTTNINPDLFRRYTAAEISCWSRALHSAGKLLVHHACGHLRALLPDMAVTGADVIESISPPPTGNIDIGEAFAVLPPHIALIGGIEPVFYQDCTAEELDARVEELLAIGRGRRFVLANSDSCPPSVQGWKHERVTALVRALCR